MDYTNGRLWSGRDFTYQYGQRGTKEGFDNKLVFQVASSIDIPVIASGGVGNLQHLIDGIQIGGAEAVLAASIFHFSEFTIQEAKDAMKDSGIVVRA